MRQPTAETFLKDVAAHQMTVLHHVGIYRHLQFRKPGANSWNMWFDLVTWPGNLVIRGDMGTWMFTRLDDMFAFFSDNGSGNGPLKINASYWAEKLQNGTSGGRANAKEWDEEYFAECLLDQLKNYYSFEGEELERITQAVKDEVLCQDNRHDLMVSARDFEFDRAPADGGKFSFDSCEIPDGMEYSFHFIWCLYAIVWGIQQWDAVLEQTHGDPPIVKDSNG